jgi:hypothetical protein
MEAVAYDAERLIGSIKKPDESVRISRVLG